LTEERQARRIALDALSSRPAEAHRGPRPTRTPKRKDFVAILEAAYSPAGRRLASAAAAVYGHESYLEGRSTRDLSSLDWVGWDADSTMAFARWMRTHVPSARVGLRVNTAWAMRDAGDAGIGVALFPCAFGSVCPGWRRVHAVRDVSAPLRILTHQDLKTTARVRVLRDYLAERIVARRAVIEGKRSPIRL
jgi:DNA-binding transcriptional LysR family regulator